MALERLEESSEAILTKEELKEEINALESELEELSQEACELMNTADPFDSGDVYRRVDKSRVTVATELRTAVACGARVIGVNNRNLKDFSVDTGNSRRLRELAPSDVSFVSESGVRTAEDIQLLREAGVNAVLIGETLMRAADKKAKLRELKGQYD